VGETEETQEEKSGWLDWKHKKVVQNSAEVQKLMQITYAI